MSQVRDRDGAEREERIAQRRKGQTSPEKLACLCRRGHNAKTHQGWRYHRTPEGSYLWTSPAGLRYLVTPGRGTEQLDD